MAIAAAVVRWKALAHPHHAAEGDDGRAEEDAVPVHGSGITQ